MRLPTVILLLAVAGSAQADPVTVPTPEAAFAKALADAERLPPQEAYVTRYLTLYNAAILERADGRASISYWRNGTSTEAEIVRPRLIDTDLVAVNLLDYGPHTIKAWEAYADSDPYFHVKKVAVVGSVQARFSYAGRTYRAGWYKTTVTSATKATTIQFTDISPYVAPEAHTKLAVLTNSLVPIVRGDWWCSQIAVQADRKGTGYYDQLGVGKRRGDFEKIVGMDRPAATRLKKEVAAIIDTSVVALHNRQVYRFQTLTGAYWETRDVANNTGQRNAVRFLNGDYQHDAEEIYGTLPNGLFAFFLSDAGGTRADTAPDSIASDGRSASTDRRVHVGLSCARCHVEGIRPIDCWARKAYAAPDKLAVVDPARFLRLRQLYLSDLERLMKRDQADYAAALLLANGLTPADNAQVVATVWERYVERPVTLADVAREMGTTPEKLQAAIKAKDAAEGILDPTLLALGKGMTLRREYVEEMWPVLMGLKP